MVGIQGIKRSITRLALVAAAGLLLAPVNLPAPAPPAPSIPADYAPIWAAQSRLVAQATASMPARNGRGPKVFTVAIAAGGSQALFGREAEAVRGLVTRRLGRNAVGVLLSNAAAHHSQAPLANRENLSAVLNAVGERFDPASDLAVIYLTAHGAPNGSLQTDLPNFFGLRPIDATYLAQTLNSSGIGRRIVIVSACFSGTWIAPLAAPDAIVLTASAANRTSFGCDDRREYTYFGAALLGGSLGEGATWRAAFERMQADIGLQERSMGLPPSYPAFYVGTGMEAVWNAPLGLPARR